jgi:hypothetical protein
VLGPRPEQHPAGKRGQIAASTGFVRLVGRPDLRPVVIVAPLRREGAAGGDEGLLVSQNQARPRGLSPGIGEGSAGRVDFGRDRALSLVDLLKAVNRRAVRRGVGH